MTFKTESMTRSIAQWCSAAVAITFGVVFVTDKTMSWDMVSNQIYVGLIVAMIFGYVLALTKRYEALGSVMATMSMSAVYIIYMLPDFPTYPADLFFLVVGAPALFHLLAIVLHHYELKWVKS